MRIAISILLALLLVACEQGFSKRAAKPDGASRYVHSKFRSYFHSIAPAEYLGEDWQASGVDSVRRIWASSGGDRALILLRGAGAPALWLNRESSRMGRPLRLEHAPLYVDVQRGVAYAADGARLLERKLPEGEWETRFGADGRGEVLAVAGHAMGESVWVVLDETQTASELAKEREEQHVLDSGATPPLPEPVKEVHGDPDKPVRTLTAARLIGDELQTMQLPAGDPDAAVQLVALKDGTAFATVGSSAYLLDPAAGSTLAQEVYAGEGRLLLAADLMDNVAWVYAPPQGASSGATVFIS